ncbi:ATPase [bacterium]|nr:HAMP domain-containing protein [Chloroflexi bacterium CFX6]RIL11509.1 MAG: ATPase [bacterium]
MSNPVATASERLWAIVGGVSVRAKILGIVLGLVLLLGLGLTAQVRLALTRALDTQLAEQSESVARDLAARATDLILVNDLYGLHEMMDETVANNPSVRYAFVLDTRGDVLAHTFGDGFPRGLAGANRVAATDHHRTVVIQTEAGPVWDTAVPVFDGRAGVARVGLSEHRVRRVVDIVIGQLLITTVLVSVAGITAAGGLTWLLTRPILQLADAARAVGRGDLSRRVPRWADDEIGNLAEAFNAMADDLAAAEVERTERDQLRARYVSGVIGAQEDERKRIARELHDSTSQSLTSILVGLKALATLDDPTAIRTHAEDLRALAANTLDDVHALALQLRPSVLDDLGLAAALERFVADFQRRHPVAVDLVVRGLSGMRLPPELETALYRIVQEALTNVARHADAATTSILLEQRDGRVRAVIEDDGRGFDASRLGADQRLGLYGIRERAELLGGTLVIETEPGRGTSLFVDIPFQKATAPDG